MPRFGLATLNHSPMHGLPAQWETHVAAAAEAGFDAIAPDIFWLRRLEEESVSLQRVARVLKQAGLACMEIAGIAIGTPEETRSELDEIARYAETFEAEFVNARIVAPMSDAVVEACARCAEVFLEKGTRLALEFSRGTTLRGVADAEALAERVDLPGVGVTIDTWHFFLAPGGPDWAAVEALSIERLANVQLSDGVPYTEGTFARATMNERRLPGAGDFDLDRLVRLLAEKGFGYAAEQGAIIAEVLSAEGRAQPVEAFARSVGEASRVAWR